MATSTQVPEQEQAIVRAEQSQLFKSFAESYQLTPKAMVQTLIQTVFPHGERDTPPTWAQLAMFMSVARQYNLNPFTRQIYAFPDKNGGVVPIVPIDGWVAIVQREKQHDGLKFRYHWQDGSSSDGPVAPAQGALVAITAIIYRKDQQHPTEVTEYLSECYRETGPWKSMKMRMLRHKALMQCARYAYGLAGIYDEDEGRDIISGGPIEYADHSDVTVTVDPKATRTEAVRTLMAANDPTAKGEVPEKRSTLPQDESGVSQATASDASASQPEQSAGHTPVSDAPVSEKPSGAGKKETSLQGEGSVIHVQEKGTQKGGKYLYLEFLTPTGKKLFARTYHRSLFECLMGAIDKKVTFWFTAKDDGKGGVTPEIDDVISVGGVPYSGGKPSYNAGSQDSGEGEW